MLWTFFVLVLAVNADEFRPCSELSRDLRLNCLCKLGPEEPDLDGNPSIFVNCDKIVFPGDGPSLPFGAPIISFRQRYVGHQSLPTQIFQNGGWPLRIIDFGGNSLRRLTERLLQGLKSSLVELRLADNLLGDTLNPIFSTSEFRGLKHLQVLDLSGNVIKSIEEGILEGCDNLLEFYLERNNLVTVPSLSLNGPKTLKLLALKANRIRTIKSGAFHAQRTLEKIDLSHNYLQVIESGAFDSLLRLKSLQLSHNKLAKLNSDIFQGAQNLQTLDLSQNFIAEFPNIALQVFTTLRQLNLSSNLIRNLDNNNLGAVNGLQTLDLSRNSIANIGPGTFLGLKHLKFLDLGVNSLRTIEDDAFEGLDNLEFLSLKDNNILLIPASALGRLPKLVSLQLDYNRVAALSGDILRSIAEKVTRLVLAKNVVRELPTASFQYFQHLTYLDLTRNLLTTINSDAFLGLENTLKALILPQNKITSFTGVLTLAQLETLDLSDNHLTELSRAAFSNLPALKSLNLSHNAHLTTIPSNLLHKLDNLEIFDFSGAGLHILTTDFFIKSTKLRNIYLQENNLSELSEGVFKNLLNLTLLDLSSNSISNVKPGAFANVMNLKELYLGGNQLSSFKGEFFNTGTSLEVLDISRNQLSYLFPSSFRIHPRLKRILASNNKFNFFPSELIAPLQFLEELDLSSNMLKTVEELDFGRLPRLRRLDIHNNALESLSEMAFHNSTQLQIVDLEGNQLERLAERTFEGLIRLEYLNLKNNLLSDLPDTIFERTRVQMLENINLAGNKFDSPPLRALQRQYFFISSVDLSRNNLQEIPVDDSILVNIKKLDLSFNPLSEATVQNILGEPKTIRELNLAGTGLKKLSPLETPFLTALNVSNNKLEDLEPKLFERTTLLEKLDLSGNELGDLSDYSKIWGVLKNLNYLDLSRNPINQVSEGVFDGLDSLLQLRLISLPKCEKIEKGGLKPFQNLVELEAFDYPKLGYMDLKGLLHYLPSLENLNIESKDASIGSDQLKGVLHPRLKQLGLFGPRLRSISSGSLSGLKAPLLTIRLTNTSITSIPPAIFFPVPRSSKITLNVGGSHLTSLSPQLLSSFEDRRGDLRIEALETNPITCDCNARALRRWLPSYMPLIKCTGPTHLAQRPLQEVGDDELTCNPRTTPSSSPPPTVPRQTEKTTEPEIIWSVPPSSEKPPQPSTKTASLNNDDTLIIGIVGGVVAFIAILIIIICIIRLRMSGSQYRGGALPAGAIMGAPMGSSSCACSVKGGGVYPMTGYPYSATLPHKMAPSVRPGSYSTMGRLPHYPNATQPYFIAVPPDENKVYR